MGAGWLRQLLCLALTVLTAVPGSPLSPLGDYSFEIVHVQSGKCLTAENDRLSVGNCANTNNSIWKWGSGHRLFSLGTQKCLGVDITKPQDPLKLVPCDSLLMLWWRCDGHSVSGASGYKLSVRNATVTAAMKAKDEWGQNGKPGAICDIPYHVVYTTGGNSNGKPCDFPFLYKETWYHDCIYDAENEEEWCATSQNYNIDGLLGNCLKPVNGCDGTWNPNTDLNRCYQFNVNSVLKWKEAYLSCQSQGADLLSISNPEELKFITETENLPDSIWFGLNRLESSGGWQWSDNSPLAFVNWVEGISAFSPIDGTSCGKLNVHSGQFDIFPCDAALPYVCEKRLNETKPWNFDYWLSGETECPVNWIGYHGFCYGTVAPVTWPEARGTCVKENATLISFHSLADIELVVTKFLHKNENLWTGLWSQTIPPVFNWSDGSKVDITYWDQNEPLPPFNVTPNCVSFSDQTGRWNVRNCSEKYKPLCRKFGLLKNATIFDTECPSEKNLRRHGDYCYSLNLTEVSFEGRCSLTITNQFEQEFLNSILRQQSNIEGKYFWTSLQDVNATGDYYWQTARGPKDPTFSNWNTHQPASAGGCVAMSAGGASLGKWEVRDCKKLKAFSICKRKIGPEEVEEPTKPPPTTCPEDWKHGEDLFCYKLFHKERLLRQRTWEEAEGICEEFGGHLVSFSHMQDMNNLYTFLKSMLGSTSKTRWVWLGLNKRNLGNWEWSDGKPISSTVLSDFQDDDYSLRDCIAFEINLPKRAYWMGIMDITFPDTNYRLKPFHCEAQLDWVCRIPKGKPVKTPRWYQPDWSDKGESVLIEGDRYWFVADPKLSYKEAALYCAINGSELATLQSYSATKGVQEHLNKQAGPTLTAVLQNWWIKPSDFKSPHPFFLYRLGSAAGRECQRISALSHYQDLFKVVNCNEKLPFICKSQNISLMETLPTNVSNSTKSCSTGMQLFGNKCYLKVPDKSLTFVEAIDYCNTYGGTLPTISNQHEQDFITYLSANLKKKFWIGLRLALNSYKNIWVDDTDVTYTNFHPILQGRFKRFQYDPFNQEKNQQCVFLLNDPKSSFVGTWDFTACSDQLYVSLCQKNAEKRGTTAPPSVPEQTEYEGRTYKFIQKNMTWYEALSECKNQKMELASITDQYQHSFITVTVSQLGQPMWIGLSNQDDGIHYRWQDGSPVTLNRWSVESQDENCAFVSLDTTWKTESCDVQLPGAVCYVPDKPEDKKQANHTDCPHTIGDNVWIPFRNSCYTFLLTHKRWLSSTTRYICHTAHPDAYVLSIRDEEENAFVSSLVQPYTDLAKWVWLGLLYDSSANGFRWHDETFVRYSNWREGRPNVNNDSFYAGMRIDGFWDIFPSPKDFQLLYLQQHSIVACKIDKGSKGDLVSPLPTAIPYYNSSYFVLKKKLTWFEAAKECQQKGAHLASVHDDKHQLFLEYIVRQDGFQVWIGLWNNDGTGMEWSDGREIDFAAKFIQMHLGPGNCTYLNTRGVWNVKSCSSPVDGAICYKPSWQVKLAGEDEELCPKTPGAGRWVRYKDFCYGFDMQIYNYSVYNNTEASTICQTVDPTSSLLAINDEEENVFISRSLNSDPYVTSRIWLGVDSSSTDQKSVWLDGTPVKYTKWASSQRQPTGPCVILLPHTGTWHKVPCAQGLGRVVCKAPPRSNAVGAAIAFAVALIIVLLVGSLVYLYRKKSPFFSSVRYQRAEDQMESMIDYS